MGHSGLRGGLHGGGLEDGSNLWGEDPGAAMEKRLSEAIGDGFFVEGEQ